MSVSNEKYSLANRRKRQKPSLPQVWACLPSATLVLLSAGKNTLAIYIMALIGWVEMYVFMVRISVNSVEISTN